MQARVGGEVVWIVVFHGALAHAGLMTAAAASILRFEDAFTSIWLRNLADFISVHVALVTPSRLAVLA